jgi:hypothetical protein
MSEARSRTTVCGLVLLAVVAGAAAGCGSPAPGALRGAAQGYILTIDQLPSPDFTVYQAPAAVGAGWLDKEGAASLGRDGFQQAATVEYYRQVALDTSNGPITVTAAVARFAAAGGAAAAMSLLDTALDHRSGAAVVSTGPLGDGGHAITQMSTLDGVSVSQIVMVWRVDNLVNSITGQGRFGGITLDDLLTVAHAQTADEEQAGPTSS